MLKRQRFNLKSVVIITTLFTTLHSIETLNYDKFILGKSLFKIPWIEAPSATTARDGLGPLFSANTCISCHPNNLKGEYLNINGDLSRAVVGKLSLENGQMYEKTYGSQISINAIHGVKYEAKIYFLKTYINDLEKPNYYLKDLQYGPLEKNTILSVRVAPTLNGMGYMENLKDEDILKNADENDLDNDGISGRVNMVYSKISQKEEIGKFGYKAQISTLKEQIANAAHNDMGLTTTLYPNETCTQSQTECQNAPKARDIIDIPNERLDAMEYYLKNIKTYQNLEFKKIDGYKVFKELKCNSCHIENISSSKNLAMFSDLLLHDMGENLADGRVEGVANKSEFRTTPLWGLSKFIGNKNIRYMHDGRAKDLNEAILWHGGEGTMSKEKYKNLNDKEKNLLIDFLERL